MSLGVEAGVAAAVSYHSLTGGSYISKSDRPYAERMGWEVVHVFKDEGRSGYTGELTPGFEEMIKFLGGGQADVLSARHHDRLTRNPDDFARLMQICGKAKIKISLYTGGELDLSTASGGFYGFMEIGRSWYVIRADFECSAGRP
jgi:DNA invertase Pin-like site-specific DNA recombinase